MKATVENMHKIEGTNAFAVCPEHPWQRYSANPRDYFWTPPTFVMDCPECGRDMALVRERTRLVRAK